MFLYTFLISLFSLLYMYEVARVVYNSYTETASKKDCFKFAFKSLAFLGAVIVSTYLLVKG